LRNQERKRHMSRNASQKRGFALGAIFALVASMFAAFTPANAAPTPAILINPVVGSSYVTPIDEDFTLAITRNPESALSSADYALLKYQIVQSTTWSMNIRADQSGGATASAVVAASASTVIMDTFFYNGGTYGSGTTTSALAMTQSFVVVPDAVQAGQTQKLSIALGNEGDQILSTSPEVTVTVTAFIDYNGDNKYSAADTVASTQTITFRPYASLGYSVSLGSLVAGDTNAFPSATISGFNVEQLDGRWGFEVTQHLPTGLVTNVVGTVGFESFPPRTFTWSAPATFERTVPIRAASASHTVSAALVYFKGSDSDTSSSSNHVIVVKGGAQVTVAAAGASAMSFHAVTGDNAKAGSSANGYDVRGNSTFTVRITVSGAISASNPVATVTFSNTAVSSLKNYSVNGGTSVVSGTASAISVTVDKTTGVGSFTLATSGFAEGDFISMSARIAGLSTVEIAVQPVALVWTVTADSDYIATAPATAFAAGVTVKDQFLVKSSLTTQRVKFGWTAGYSGSATNSFVVLSGGEADASITPSRTPSTGSATLTYTLQNYNSGTGNWTDDGGTNDSSTVYITSDANGFRTGLAASYSASISYGADFSWSSVINAASVVVTGSQVVVSGTGLIFKDSAGDTASDSITLPGSSNGVASFYVTARLAGTYTVTLTAGSATTTSQIVVMPARSDDGASITWDTTAITAGRTKIVTGRVLDANGNPVDTTAWGSAAGDSGTASVLVTFAGDAGIPVGSMPTETNADGEFQVSVLTSAADNGTFTLTAVYLPQGSSTAAADKVTSVQAIQVGDTVAASSDQKVNAGSFKGYVAIYAKGYEGQRLSAKVVNDWVVVESLASNFERVVEYTGAGYTIAVRIYIDRVLVDTITVTTK
jgi:hypothetical protein